MTVVKICGIRSVEELEFVERYADFAGIVMDSKSKRFVGPEKAREIIETSSIPVFVVLTSAGFEEAYRIACDVDAENLQIHSEKFPVEDFLKLKDHGFRMIKAFRVPRLSDNFRDDAEKIVRKIREYRPHFPLLDTGKGCGKVHDLRVSREVAKAEKVILAGGLNPENVRSIVEYVKPWGVDVSSGVERNGRKDSALIREFVEVVRG